MDDMHMGVSELKSSAVPRHALERHAHVMYCPLLGSVRDGQSPTRGPFPPSRRGYPGST